MMIIRAKKDDDRIEIDKYIGKLIPCTQSGAGPYWFSLRGCLKITYFTQFKVLSEEFNPQNTMYIPLG
jgi:hypothetical protein